MRTLIHWQPKRDLTIVRRHLDQIFDELSHINLESAFSKPQDLGKTWIPAVELKEYGHAWVLRVELAGVAAKDLDVQVSREAVTISGEYPAQPKTEQSGLLRSEFQYGKFHRVVPIRAAIQHDQVKAEFKDGILTLTLPKVEAPKVVKVNLSESQNSLPVDESKPAIAATPETTNGNVATATDFTLSDDVWIADTLGAQR